MNAFLQTITEVEICLSAFEKIEKLLDRMDGYCQKALDKKLSRSERLVLEPDYVCAQKELEKTVRETKFALCSNEMAPLRLPISSIVTVEMAEDAEIFLGKCREIVFTAKNVYLKFKQDLVQRVDAFEKKSVPEQFFSKKLTDNDVANDMMAFVVGQIKKNPDQAIGSHESIIGFSKKLL